MLLFFRARGRFPRAAAEVDGAAVAELARSLGVPEPSTVEPLLPDAADRTGERQRADIRAPLGFREAGVADAEALVPWLRDHAVARTRDPAELAAGADARCRALRIEPPTLDRIGRVVRAALRAYEDRHVAAVHARLTPAMRVGLDALLQPGGPEEATEAKNRTLPDGRLDAPLVQLRAGPGRASVASLREELARLGMVCGIGLPDGLFAGWSPAELETCRQRVAVEAPYELRRHPEATRQAWLAAYTHLRGRAVTDTLVDLLIETVHHIGARAESRVEQELLDDLKRVGGKQALLFGMADAAVETPDGTVREVLYPVVGEQTLRDLVREAKARSQGDRSHVPHDLARHHPQLLPRQLPACGAGPAGGAGLPLQQRGASASDPGAGPGRRYAGTRLQAYPVDEDVPIEGVVRPLWRDAVVDRDPQGRPRVNCLVPEVGGWDRR